MRSLFLSLCLTVVALVASSGCATRTYTLKDMTRDAYRLSAAVDDAERDAYAAKLYPEEKHLLLADVVTRLLLAARAFDSAVIGITDQPVGIARMNFLSALEDLEQSIAGVPALDSTVKAVRALMGS